MIKQMANGILCCINPSYISVVSCWLAPLDRRRALGSLVFRLTTKNQKLTTSESADIE